MASNSNSSSNAFPLVLGFALAAAAVWAGTAIQDRFDYRRYKKNKSYPLPYQQWKKSNAKKT